MKYILPFMMLFSVILVAANPAADAVIGKINEKSYTYSEYNEILTKYYTYHETKQGAPLTAEDKAKLNDQCWEELVGRYVYDQAIQAGVIKVTEKELLDEARNNPPASLRQIDDLWKNGKFQQKQYEEALRNAPQFKQAVLDDIRWNYQYKKLVDTLKGTATVDEDSVRMEWVRQHELVDAQIIVFDAAKLTTVSCSEDEARKYYHERLEEYRKDNSRKLHYVHFPKTGSVADSLATQERVFEMYEQLRQGADFAQMARDFSQDTGSGKNGGDLGWFGRGRMVKPFEDAAFSTPVGEISEPVLSKFGWHLIQTIDRRVTDNGEEVNARHILLRVIPSETTLQKMKTDSATLYMRAKEIGLAPAALELGFKLNETPAFQEKEGFINPIGSDPKLIAFAFSNPEGTLADVYHSPNGDTFVCAISAVLPVYYKPFEDDAVAITNSATKAKRGYYMNEYAHNFVKNIPKDKYLEWAERDSIMVVEISAHRKGDNIASLGKPAVLEEVLFSSSPGTFGDLISEPMKWYLVKVNSHITPTQDQWIADKADAVKKAVEDIRTKRLNDWYFQQRKTLSIIDNRRDYYDLSLSKKSRQIKL